MEAVKKEKGFQKGVSGNPSGRPKGTGRPVSKLRSTQNKLQRLEPRAIEIIEKALNELGQDKEQVAVAKWVVQTLVTVTRAATADEESRKQAEDPEDTPEESGSREKGNVVRFTTKIVED